MARSAFANSQAENVQPAYAEGFGVAGAHLSRRSGSEGGTSNPSSPWTGSAVASVQLRKNSRARCSIADKSVQEILAILHKWGIHTLGQLAALDKEQFRARLGPEGVRLWERANGRSNRLLKFVQSPESFDESFEFEHEIETAQPLLFMLRRFLEQLALRLSAIYLVAKEITLRITFSNPPQDGFAAANKQIYERFFKIPQPINDVDLLFRMLHTHLENFKSEHPIVAVAFQVQPIKPASQQFGLFETSLRNPQQLYETLARLAALVGNDRVGTPILEETHRPDAFRMERFSWSPRGEPHRDWTGTIAADTAASTGNPGETPLSGATTKIDFGGHRPPLQKEGKCAIAPALRRFRPPARTSVFVSDQRYLQSDKVRGQIIKQSGPFLLSGNWWDEKAWARAEWDMQLEDGELVRAHEASDTWKLDGVYD